MVVEIRSRRGGGGGKGDDGGGGAGGTDQGTAQGLVVVSVSQKWRRF